MSRRAAVLFLVLSLTGRDSARAQSLTGIAGFGMTASGPDISATDFHALGAIVVGLGGHLGARVEALLSEVPQGKMFAPSVDLVLGIGEEGVSGKGGYLLAGGSLILSGGETHPGFNAGIGYGFAIQPRYSLVLESRYMHVLGGADPSIVLLTLELQIPLRSR